jgi:hypothetical protein
MDMTYEKAMRKYFTLKRQVDLIEGETKAKVAPLKENMALLSQWLEAKGQEQGLKNIAVDGVGTGYWSTHINSSVADRDVFFGFVKENEAWDLLETRASKTAVKSYIEAHNQSVPGVNFSQVQVFNIRQASAKDKSDTDDSPTE